jgi:DNA-binding PadR family transcriptional regulator
MERKAVNELDLFIVYIYRAVMPRLPATSRSTRLILAAFASRPGEWRHGYDLCREVGVKSGTLYPMLIRLADQGLLVAEWREAERPGRPPRHAYRLTPKGLAFARSQESGPERAAAARAALA